MRVALPAWLTEEMACRPHPDKDVEAVVVGMGEAAVKQAVAKLLGFLEDLHSIPAAPVSTTVEDWKRRLGEVDTREQLGSAVLDLEADVNMLGSGLPTGAWHFGLNPCEPARDLLSQTHAIHSMCLMRREMHHWSKEEGFSSEDACFFEHCCRSDLAR